MCFSASVADDRAPQCTGSARQCIICSSSDAALLDSNGALQTNINIYVYTRPSKL